MRLRTWARWLVSSLLQVAGGYRLWWRWQRSRSGKAPVCVLGLHRVLRDDDRSRTFSQSAIILRKATFARLLAYLKERFELVPGESLLGERGSVFRKPACVVTFDDGWVDNFTEALPELRRLQIPATLVVATGYLGSANTFWVERALAALAGPRADDIRREIALLARPKAGMDDNSVIEYLKHMPVAQREPILARLLPDGEVALPVDRLMTWEQLGEMHSAGVEIGGHTATHPLLTFESDESVRQELSGSKQAIERRLGISVRSFAYPNGDYDDRVRLAVRKAGYACAYTTRSGWFTPGDDLYSIPRYLLHEGNVTGPDGEFSPAMFEFTIAGWRRG